MARPFREWIFTVGTLPEDSHEERVIKATLLIVSMFITGAAVIWSTTYLLLGRPEAAAIPGAYFVISTLSIIVFAITKKYGFFRFSQTVMLLLLPTSLQLVLGGLAHSSAVILWCYPGVLGGLMFYKPKQAWYWLAIFVMLLIGAAILDPYVEERFQGLSRVPTIAFIIGNIGGVLVCSFFFVRHYVLRSANALAEVRQQQAVTEEARAVAEDARATIAAQADRLQELDRAKTQFFANVSHELRTPLTLLLGPLESTLDDKVDRVPERGRRRLELAARNGRRLLRQINLLLDFTKAEAGRMELELAPEDPIAVARAVVEETQPATRARNIFLSFSAPATAEPMEIDRERIDQVLLNLIGNAIKFTPEGGRIEVAVATAESEVEFRVTDNGIGIPEADVPHVFEAFRQARRDRSTDSASALYRQESGGTGLGLSIVKQIVDLHKGRVEVVSKQGQGTTFRVVIPRLPTTSNGSARPSVEVAERVAPTRKTSRSDSLSGGSQPARRTELADLSATAQEPSPAPAGKAEGAGGRTRILLVDDNPDVRAYLIDLLHGKFAIAEAADGQEGIDRAREIHPDLIISDVMMPKRSGFELVEELKGNARTATIPILLLTARGGAVVEGLERGADDYLQKPFEPKELTARVNALLRVTRMERDLAAANSRLVSELEAARMVQQALMPHADLQVAGVDIGAKLVPASKLSGDYFDFFAVNGSREIGVVIGDVAGHGASSALVAALAKASLEANIKHASEPAAVLEGVASMLFRFCQGTKHMTMLYGLLDREHLSFRYSNAGHTFPYCYRHREDMLFSMVQPGVPLGFERSIRYDQKVVQLEAGDIVLFHSDGMLEARAPTLSEEPYGVRRLKVAMKKHAGLPAGDLASALIQDVLDYSKQEPNDDITALVIKIPSSVS